MDVQTQMPDPDSSPQAGVPTGQVTKHTWAASRIYPGATHDYWVYVPAQYTAAKPACVTVFQDGQAYLDPAGPVRAPTVFDNLIHKGEMPVTIGVFVNPGAKQEVYDQRQVQYVPLDDTYARFLLDEILPQVGWNHDLVDDPAGRAICGMSDGGLCAFTVAWERPDAFRKVISHIGSFTRLRGGSEYPYLIRQTRGSPKPLRVFLQDGQNDINLTEGSWTLANMTMASALMFARYDYRFELGTGGHDLKHGGEIFPDTLRWLWRDYPGVKSVQPGFDAVVGAWDVVTNANGAERHGVLTISRVADGLDATLVDADDGKIELTRIGFDDGILSYEYVAPPSQRNWGKGSVHTMETWLKVAGGAFEGALSGKTDPVLDFSVTGQRRQE